MNKRKLLKNLTLSIFCMVLSFSSIKANALGSYDLTYFDYNIDGENVELVKCKDETSKNLCSPICEKNVFSFFGNKDEKKYDIVKVCDDFSLIKEEEVLKEYKVFGFIPCAEVWTTEYTYAKIKNIDLPKCEYLGKRAFKEIDSLSKVSLPSCETIEEGAFERCKYLESIDVSDKYVDVKDNTFKFCSSLKNFSNWENIRSIGNYAFCATRLKDITLPKCEAIGEGAFGNCRNLYSVTLNNEIKEIKKDTFYGCYNLKEINDCDNVEILRERAFAFCRNLETANFEKCVEAEEFAFNDCNNLKYANLCNCKKASNAIFAGCYNLEEVNLDNCEEVEYKAFLNNSSLKEINLPKCKKIAECGFSKCEYYYASGIGGEGCKNLKVLKAPMCEYVGKQAFADCISLEEVDLSSCKEIGEEAFANCSSLKILCLPQCEKIGQNAFSGCTNLGKIIVPKGCLYQDDDIENATNLPQVEYVDNCNVITNGCEEK